MGIGFILGIVFLQATLFVIALKKEDLVLYVGTGLFYYPLKAICKAYYEIRCYFFNKKYVRCNLYQEPCTFYNMVIIERKDLDKFYWKGENEFYVEPSFYFKNGDKYEKRVLDYRMNNIKMLSWHMEKNTHIAKRINLYLRKENENGN